MSYGTDRIETQKRSCYYAYVICKVRAAILQASRPTESDPVCEAFGAVVGRAFIASGCADRRKRVLHFIVGGGQMNLRGLFASLVSALLIWACLPTQGLAQTYPNRPVRFILPAAAGGVQDVVMRRLTDGLSRSLGQPVVVENRPGANGFIGAEAAARARQDGYTVLFAAVNVLCINPALFSQMPYDPVRDFTPVTLAGRGNPILLVGQKLPVRTFSEFIQYPTFLPQPSLACRRSTSRLGMAFWSRQTRRRKSSHA